MLFPSYHIKSGFCGCCLLVLDSIVGDVNVDVAARWCLPSFSPINLLFPPIRLDAVSGS